MTDEWLTYAEAAERLSTTVEGVRLRALRGRWQKTLGNDKRPRIRLPDGWSNDVRTANERRERKTRNDGRTTVERANGAVLVRALESHIKTLQGENETVKQQLAAAEARFAAADASLTAERARTEQAIAAFASLADRLDAMAAEKRRPWWRR